MVLENGHAIHVTMISGLLSRCKKREPIRSLWRPEERPGRGLVGNLRSGKML